jgi:hypothetical protein
MTTWSRIRDMFREERTQTTTGATLPVPEVPEHPLDPLTRLEPAAVADRATDAVVAS